ncbi:MAG: helix-turn-helix transcriptional regulator [Paludibacteraceae bacterium]|nr:helix-turn-helix transcriptional regulator [Paludibacteraceae bacterium]
MVNEMTPVMLKILLCNIPAYLCAVLAAWRKFNNGQYYEGSVFVVIMLDLVAIAYFLALVLDPVTATSANQMSLAGLASLLIPLLYMFHAPAGGQQKINKTTIVLFLLTFIFFLPATSIELVPAYATRYFTRPMDDMGVSIFYCNRFITHIHWIAIILWAQAIVALYQVQRAIRFVHAHGGHYSWVTRLILAWDFNCGFFIAIFFALPKEYWYHTAAQWIGIITASIIIGVGSLLIFLGFDLNPVADEDGQRTSIQEFMTQNGELVNKLRYLLEERQIYLERGIQAETLIQQLGTNYVYFDRIMRSQYGVSFPEYVHRSRIQYAKELMAHKLTPSIDSIAQQCGYENTEAFIGLYERITDEKISPYT